MIRGIGDEIAKGRFGIVVVAFLPEGTGQLKLRGSCRGSSGEFLDDVAEATLVPGRDKRFAGLDLLCFLEAFQDDVNAAAEDDQRQKDKQLLLVSLKKLVDLGRPLFDFADGGGMIRFLRRPGGCRSFWVFWLLFFGHGSAGQSG